MQNIAFDALVHGVYVITTRLGDKVNGMTASWVAQVSLSPLLLMVSIAPPRYTHDLIAAAASMR
jgi:flavin reductase (DIM6/NTAB) family NADH-FMN oxidoreductase RutF